jgi:hypothetical protein
MGQIDSTFDTCLISVVVLRDYFLEDITDDLIPRTIDAGSFSYPYTTVIHPSRDNQRKLVWRLYLRYGSYRSDSISLHLEHWETLRCLLSPLCTFYMNKRPFLSLALQLMSHRFKVFVINAKAEETCE